LGDADESQSRKYFQERTKEQNLDLYHNDKMDAITDNKLLEIHKWVKADTETDKIDLKTVFYLSAFIDLLSV
jgi:hypothetical protein